MRERGMGMHLISPVTPFARFRMRCPLILSPSRSSFAADLRFYSNPPFAFRRYGRSDAQRSVMRGDESRPFGGSYFVLSTRDTCLPPPHPPAHSLKTNNTLSSYPSRAGAFHHYS